jgi:hypothetical protein
VLDTSTERSSLILRKSSATWIMGFFFARASGIIPNHHEAWVSVDLLQGAWLEFDPLIMESCRDDLLLGTDVLHAAGCIVDFQRKTTPWMVTVPYTRSRCLGFRQNIRRGRPPTSSTHSLCHASDNTKRVLSVRRSDSRCHRWPQHCLTGG